MPSSFLVVVVTSISGILTSGTLMRNGGFSNFAAVPRHLLSSPEGIEASSSAKHMRLVRRMEAMPKMESLANMMKKLDCREGVSRDY